MSMIVFFRFSLMQLLFWSAGVVFAYPMKRRENLKRRIFSCLAVIAVYSGVFWNDLWSMDYTLECIGRIISMVLMVVFLYGGWETKLSIAVYNAIWTISVWRLLGEVWHTIENMGGELFVKYPYMGMIGMLLLYVINYFWIGKTIAKWMPMDRRDSIGPRQLGSAILIFLIIEVLSMTPALKEVAERNYEWHFLYVSQLMAIFILYMQSELFKKSSIKQELELMNLLWKNKQEQYELAKENIELINQKCHDLKHYIQVFRNIDKAEFEAYLNDMEEKVSIYEAIVKTGNDVFDTILTQKCLYCRKRNIQVSCVADGSQMDFIETIDLYAILGNALDNAIEAVDKFEDLQKRQIDVIIHRQNQFLVMNFINPLPEELVYETEFPVTTKGDKKYHGFGLRSIRHFVKKYDGMMNISEEDGCFSLKIMIPIS